MNVKRIFLSVLAAGALCASIATASTYDLTDFRDAVSGAQVKAVNMYGSDAQALFDFIRTQTPSTYSSTTTSNFKFEHVNGLNIFCVKDSVLDSGGNIVSSTYRCDFVVSGEGKLAPPLEYIGSY